MPICVALWHYKCLSIHCKNHESQGRWKPVQRCHFFPTIQCWPGKKLELFNWGVSWSSNRVTSLVGESQGDLWCQDKLYMSNEETAGSVWVRSGAAGRGFMPLWGRAMINMQRKKKTYTKTQQQKDWHVIAENTDLVICFFFANLWNPHNTAEVNPELMFPLQIFFSKGLYLLFGLKPSMSFADVLDVVLYEDVLKTVSISSSPYSEDQNKVASGCVLVGCGRKRSVCVS